MEASVLAADWKGAGIPLWAGSVCGGGGGYQVAIFPGGEHRPRGLLLLLHLLGFAAREPSAQTAQRRKHDERLVIAALLAEAYSMHRLGPAEEA